ncbi:alpha/beta fold hydrolase [Marinobacter halodurans]|nr:alpha/beta fold hydrolase [Marinobacter halodurans]
MSTPVDQLTLISGWGAPVGMIESWVDGLAAEVAALSLDDALLADSPTFDAAVDTLLARTCGRQWLVGWSLGGLLAMAMAQRAPERVAGVITVCTHPCFVSRDDGDTGMAPGTFAGFREGLERHADRQWQRFMRLQVHGTPDGRRQLAPWLESGAPASEAVLSRTLEWLAQVDQRRTWADVNGKVPVRHLFGRRDPLVDPACADSLRAQGGDARQLDDLFHWPFGDTATQVRWEIEAFLDEYRAGQAA